MINGLKLPNWIFCLLNSLYYHDVMSTDIWFPSLKKQTTPTKKKPPNKQQNKTKKLFFF